MPYGARLSPGVDNACYRQDRDVRQGEHPAHYGYLRPRPPAAMASAWHGSHPPSPEASPGVLGQSTVTRI